MTLVAHLGLNVVLAGGFRDLADFVNRMRQRFFAIDVLTRSDRSHDGDGVGMIGRGNQHGVDGLVHLIQHDAKVFVLFGPGIRLEHLSGPAFVHVA